MAEYKGRDNNKTSDHWKTPAYIYDPLNAEFGFDFDPCPLNNDITKWDALNSDWDGKVIYCNPPYNKYDKPKFIKKCYEEWQKGKTVVMLIPSSTGTVTFHKYIYPHAEIRFAKGRIKFEGINSKGEFTSTGSGKHDSMIVIFRPQ
jgi:site-specific DNA-methyltransferase (adenine-specific)